MTAVQEQAIKYIQGLSDAEIMSVLPIHEPEAKPASKNPYANMDPMTVFAGMVDIAKRNAHPLPAGWNEKEELAAALEEKYESSH